MPDDTVITLKVPPDTAFTQILTTAAADLAGFCGLDARGSFRFQLTVEEFFTYLAVAAGVLGRIEVALSARAYQVCATFGFRACDPCLGALNSSAVAKPDENEDIPRELGLILAGRVADRFHLSQAGDQDFLLSVEVDKTYPPAEPQAPVFEPAGPFRVIREAQADPDLLRLAAALAVGRYPARCCPGSFRTPGKFVDMVRAGQAACVLLMDAQSRPAGLMSWSRSGERGFAFAGPFVLTRENDSSEAADRLTRAFLEAVAREKAEIVFSDRATPDTPEGYFEPLGSLVLHDSSGTHAQPVLFRHLREDSGATVWSCPASEDFLRDFYERFALLREVLKAPPPAQDLRRESLFSTDIDQGKRLAVLRPLLDGADAAENLTRHVHGLAEKGIANLLLHLDLSRAWQAALFDPAGQAGFEPRFILPRAGRSDVAVLQYVQAV